MSIFVDTAHLGAARWALELPFVSGIAVTSRRVSQAVNAEVSVEDHHRAVVELGSLIPKDGIFFCYLHSDSEEGMVAEVETLLNAGVPRVETHLVVVVPFNEAGFHTVRALKGRGPELGMFGLATPNQAYMAAMSGVRYLMTSIRRMEWLEIDGLEAIETMEATLRHRDLSAELVTTVRSAGTLNRLLRDSRCHVVVPPELLQEIFEPLNARMLRS